MMNDKQNCEKIVRDGTGWHNYPCTRTATVEFEGKHYCKQHAINEGWRETEEVKRLWGVFSSEYNGITVSCFDVNISGKRAVIVASDGMYGFSKGTVKNTSELVPKKSIFDNESDAIDQAILIARANVKNIQEKLALLSGQLAGFEQRTKTLAG